MEKSLLDDPDLARSRILSTVVSSICLGDGFVKAEASAIEMLSGMLNACKIPFEQFISTYLLQM